MARRDKEYIIVYTVPAIHNVFACLVKAGDIAEARNKFEDNRKYYHKVVMIRQTSQFDWSRDPEMNQIEMQLEVI